MKKAEYDKFWVDLRSGKVIKETSTFSIKGKEYLFSETYTPIKNFDGDVFKILKRALPGPYTFLLDANNEVPKILNISKKIVGIRIPQNNISQTIVEELGNPIISASIKDEDEVVQYTANAEIIFERYKK